VPISQSVARVTDENVVEFPKKSDTVDADIALREALGKFPIVIVIGIGNDGELNFVTNHPNYTFMQWAFSKAQFDLHLHERGAKNDKS
jgi:thiamine pyrophosphokinase